MSVETGDIYENNEKYEILNNLSKELNFDTSKINSTEKEDLLYVEIANYYSNISDIDTNYNKKQNVNLAFSKVDNLLKDINLEKLMSFSVKNWILVLKYDDHTDYKNLIYDKITWDNKIDQLKETWKIARNNTEQLKENLNRESLLWWGLIVSYIATARTWNYFIDNVYIKNADNKIEAIAFEKWWLNSWSKEALKSSILKLLEKKWIKYEPINNTFYKIDKADVSKWVIKEIKNLDYKKYTKISKNDWEKLLSEKDFKKNKKVILKEIKSSNIKEVQSILWKYGFWSWIQHVIFLPVFFQTFHKNTTDLASLWKSLSEWWLFTSWAKAGSKIPWNAISKSVLWIVWWVLAIVWWEKLWEKMELNKHFWKAFPEREDYWEKKWWEWKSFLTHALTAWTVNDLVDELWFDIKIPYTPITIIQTGLNLDTDPKEYMSSWVWRNIKFWNERVDKYKKELTENIYDLVKNSRFQKSKITPLKNKWFITWLVEKDLEEKSELKELIYWFWDYEWFDEIKVQLYEKIVLLIDNPEWELNEKTITFLCDNITNNMKINDDYIERKGVNIKNKEQYYKIILSENNQGDELWKIYWRIQKEKSPLKELSKNELSFAKQIHNRILKHEKLIQNKADKKIFEKLIENPKFLEFLDNTVELKKEKDFIGNLQKFSTAVEWKWI